MAEILPDIPTIIHVLEETLQDFKDIEDFSKVTKAKLAHNQEIIVDALIDFGKYIAAKGYVLDILDKAIARLKTKQAMNKEAEETGEEIVEQIEEDLEKEAENILKGLGMFS